jgi:TatD DNase family protein
LFINIHSHKVRGGNERVIQNYHADFEEVEQPGYYSIGLHPWYIDVASREADIHALKEWCIHPQVLAIGECGLDKNCSTDFNLQQAVFAEQLHIANDISKPLILHCVKAYEELLHLLDVHLVRVPVVFHGFSKQSLPLAQKIISKGYFLSFGKALQSANMRHLLRDLPIEQIFLETDDAQLSIAAIYDLAAGCFQVTVESLSLQLQKNAALVFGSALVNS